MKTKPIFKAVLISLALLTFSTQIVAQQIESERDKIFEHVDLQQVPYGILKDYGLSSVSLLPYTKQELDTKMNLLRY